MGDDVPHQGLREESVVRCSNPKCNRGIGLVFHQRGWFSKRRHRSRDCSYAYLADLSKRPSQELRAMTYFELLFSQPIEKSLPQLTPACVGIRPR
jgi:hypothetical protein